MRERERERERERITKSKHVLVLKTFTPTFRPSWGFFKAFLVGLTDSYRPDNQLYLFGWHVGTGTQLYLFGWHVGTGTQLYLFGWHVGTGTQLYLFGWHVDTGTQLYLFDWHVGTGTPAMPWIQKAIKSSPITDFLSSADRYVFPPSSFFSPFFFFFTRVFEHSFFSVTFSMPYMWE